LWFCHKSGRA